jgi:hypothetical protein
MRIVDLQLWRVAFSLALYPVLAGFLFLLSWLSWVYFLMRTHPPRPSETNLVFRMHDHGCLRAPIGSLTNLSDAYSVDLSIILKWPDRPDLILSARQPFVLDCFLSAGEALKNGQQPYKSFAFLPKYRSYWIQMARLLFLAPLHILHIKPEEQFVRLSLPRISHFQGGHLLLCPPLPISEARIIAAYAPNGLVMRYVHFLSLKASALLGASICFPLSLLVSAIICVALLLLSPSNKRTTAVEDEELEEPKSDEKYLDEEVDLGNFFDSQASRPDDLKQRRFIRP